MFYILLAAAVLPVILLLLYVNGKDVDKEPKGLRWKLLFFGMLVVIPTGFVEIYTSKAFSLIEVTSISLVLFNTFFGIGLVEELFKFWVAFRLTSHDVEFDHRYDAIVYCVYAALGFALLENIIYVLSSGIGTAITRALLAVPSHACDAVIMGYFYGLYKECKIKFEDGKARWYILLGLFLASLEHAIYDGLILLTVNQEQYLGEVSFKYIGIDLVMVIISYIVCYIIIKRVSKIDTNYDNTKAKREKTFTIVDKTSEESYKCPYCGSMYKNDICPGCGARRE